MTQSVMVFDENPSSSQADFSVSTETAAPAQVLSRRGVQNFGNFLTPYYMFDLLGRQHGDELDPQGREPNRRSLKARFWQAERNWSNARLAQLNVTFGKTWELWYKELFSALGFELSNIKEPPISPQTARHGSVPIRYGYYPDGNTHEPPLIWLDLHSYQTDLDRATYGNLANHPDQTVEPISRAIEFVLDNNPTKWALVSNGLELRLYRKGGSVARQYLKIDFIPLFDEEDFKEWLVFWGLFRRVAFMPQSQPSENGEPSRCLLDRVIDESQRHATQIANDLRENVVRAVESLLQGVIDSPANQHLWHGALGNGKIIPDTGQLKTLFDETIYFLYRLLFVLYAESRDLLPVGDSPIYREAYSLEHLREMAERHPLKPADYDKTYYIETLRTLFRMLRDGYPTRNPVTTDSATRPAKTTSYFTIPPYNGQLFDPEGTKLLDVCHIPDRAMHDAILEMSLSRPKKKYERRERYSYADLGVDQLGSIYEGLLVYEPSICDETMVEANIKNELRLVSQAQADDLGLPYRETSIKRPGSFILRIWGGRRKGSGSYYTPQEITSFLVKDALAPLVEPVIEGCRQRDDKNRPLRKPEDILEIRVCDPAMGSGAFLIQACRYLAEAYGRARLAAGLDEDGRISSTELAYYKRRVAEKCLYGVDLNPLAVELAKVSLWLETLAKDRPLTFLDAHLRCGNSLVGAPLRNYEGKFDISRLGLIPNEAFGKATKEDSATYKDNLKKLVEANKKLLKILPAQITLFSGRDELQVIAEYEKQRLKLEESDEDKTLEQAVELVHLKQKLLEEALSGEESRVRRLRQVCDLWCAVWFWPAEAEVLPPHSGLYNELVGVIMQHPGAVLPHKGEIYLEIARQVAAEQRFFHWELEFPEVWFNSNGQPKSNGGFDAVVGNPPWDSIKPNSQEFWSNFLPTFRTLGKQAAVRAANRLRGDIEIDKLWRRYFKLFGQQVNLFKLSNLFIRQGSGDVNTYKLFLEQFVRLTRRNGAYTAVIPSGIYTDEGCTPLRRALFFRQKTNLLATVENRAEIFPIHRSFKVVLLSGQKTGDYVVAEDEDKLVFLPAGETLKCLFLIGKDANGKNLAPNAGDLGVLLNDKNTQFLELPVTTVKSLSPASLSLMEFKSQREIDLASTIYADKPLLGEKLEKHWNVRIQREFHMTDDSHLFEENPVGWALWEGKMIHQFNSNYGVPRYWVNKFEGVTELARRIGLSNYKTNGNWNPSEPKLGSKDFRLVYRKVARNTDELTLISAILPSSNFVGESINIFVQWEFSPKPQPTWERQFDESNKLYLLALLNSFVLNYVIRQKISANLSAYLLYQLPVPRLPATHPVSQAIVPLAARLTCVDERFAPLWEELAKHHPNCMAVTWTPECGVKDLAARAHLRAELDARVADLYGLSEAELAYILSTFPLLDRTQPPLPGEPKSFITRDLALWHLFKLRGKRPHTNIVTFFAEAGVFIKPQTGPVIDLEERVNYVLQKLGAIAYMPSGRGGEEADAEEGEAEEEDFE